MNDREFELYCAGYQKRIYMVREILSEMQANLINIHIPKGKGKVKPDDIFKRPMDSVEQQIEEEQYLKQLEEMELEVDLKKEDGETDAEYLKRYAKEREKRERERDRADQERWWWSSPLGQTISKLLGD